MWSTSAAAVVACRLQETLDNLRKAMENTKIMCAVMLDTKVGGGGHEKGGEGTRAAGFRQ
jgi:hypothetical protein